MVEIWPGGGWYSEILVPYLAQGGGTYIGAAPERSLTGLRKLVTAQPAAYASVRTANFPILPTAAGTPVAPGSADVVLTFRNVHNWMMGKEPFEAAAFQQMYAMLKPGGTLGVVEHRLPENADAAREKKSGYVKVSTVRRLAEGAGFRLVAMSEINANPLDNTDYPEGVWTLPPDLSPGRQGPRQICRDRRKRPHDAALRQAALARVAQAGLGVPASSWASLAAMSSSRCWSNESREKRPRATRSASASDGTISRIAASSWRL